ncbi:MAG: hypothetical protein ACREQI_12160 [Candidatus Binataceae bacterium]
MNAAIHNAGIHGLGIAGKGEPMSEGMRLAMYNLLNELPVAIFGVLTLAYLASSLLALVR